MAQHDEPLYVGDARDVLAEDARPGRPTASSPARPTGANGTTASPASTATKPDPAAYVATLRERRSARPAACWPTTGRAGSTSATPTPPAAAARPGCTPTSASTSPRTARTGLHAKNLLGLPWRVAFALQDDGWILRNAIIWHKPNAMPESVRDRLSCRYELMFLLVKSPPLLVRPRPHPHTAQDRPASRRPRTARAPAGRPARLPGRRSTAPGTPGRCSAHSATAPAAAARRTRTAATPATCGPSPPAPTPGPHFAAFPIDLPTRCIQAGCKPGGMVLDPFCGTGTTGLAALSLGRRFTGIELSPAFAALAAERLADATQPSDDPQ